MMDKNTDDFKLQEVINDLIDIDLSLCKPLMKLYYLGKLINNQELIEYTHKEINGYDVQDENIPYYRKTRPRLFAKIKNNLGVEEKPEIPFSMLEENLKNAIEATPIYFGVEYVERMKEGSLERQVGSILIPEFLPYIQPIINTIIKGITPWYVQQVESVYNSIVFFNIVSNIRTRLLDFVMEIGEKFGMNVEVNTFKKSTDTNNKIINNIMNTTIYNNGDGNFTNTGNSNSITNSTNIVKNDFESLKKELKKLNIEDKEIENLEQILSREKPNNNELGTETNNWINKMKDLGVTVSAEILASMIKSFFGIAG